MNEIYIRYLIEQYITANGMTSCDKIPESITKELAEWLYKRKSIGEQLIWWLEKKGICIDTPECAELDKGKYDSIVYPFNSTIISKYGETFDNRKALTDSEIKIANFDVLAGVPIASKKENQPDFKIINPETIETYLLHNPYDIESVEKIRELHYNPFNNVILAVYGKIYDKDMAKKLRLIEKFKNSLNNPESYYVEKIEVGDNYWYYIATRPNYKIRVKK